MIKVRFHPVHPKKGYCAVSAGEMLLPTVPKVGEKFDCEDRFEKDGMTPVIVGGTYTIDSVVYCPGEDYVCCYGEIENRKYID